MSRELSSIYKQRKALKGKITQENKKSIVNAINRQAMNYGFKKLKKNSSLNDIRNARNYYLDRMGYDILTLSIQEGNITTSEMVAQELKKSRDEDTKRLASYAKKLASVKQTQNSYLSRKEEGFMERGNLNIKGYGEKDIITLFENTKNDKEVKQLMSEILSTNPKNEYYNDQIETFRRVFQKIGIVKEDEINKLIEHLSNSTMEELTNHTNYLIQTLELYGSDDNEIGAWGGDETELANARLDDLMIRTGLKKGGIQKVKKVYKKVKSNK